MGETTSKPKEDGPKDEWGEDPQYVVKASDSNRTETVHPDIENLQSIPTFMPILRNEQLMDPAQYRVEADTLGKLHGDMSQHFTALGKHVYKEQLRILDGLEQFNKDTDKLIPQLQKHKTAVVDLARELQSVDGLQRSLADVYANLQRAIISTETLRASLPPPNSFPSFADHLKTVAVELDSGSPTKTKD